MLKPYIEYYNSIIDFIKVKKHKDINIILSENINLYSKILDFENEDGLKLYISLINSFPNKICKSFLCDYYNNEEIKKSVEDIINFYIKNFIKYYELYYFRGRKDTGSIYIKTEKCLDSFIDEDEFLNHLIEHRIIDEQTANEIVEIHEITEQEYKDMTGGN